MSDRFMLHEWLAEVIWQHDVVFYGLLGGFQVISLWFYGRRFLLMPACLLWLFLAGVAFGIMALLDMFAPHDMYLRLSLEDGFKVWSGFFFVLYSWSILKIQSREYFESPD